MRPVLRVALVAALLAGLAVRLILIAGIDRPLVSDERDYDSLAWNLHITGHYAEEGRPTAFRPIGYPLFVAAIYDLAGRSPRAVRTAQACLDLLTALVLFETLRRRAPVAAVAAAAIWSLYPPAIVTSTLLYSETLACFLAAAAALLLVKEPNVPPWSRVGLGLVLGALSLIKVVVLPMLILLPWLVLRGERRWWRAAAIAAGVLALVVPWVARNALVVGVPTLTTSIDSNLLIGNHPNATGGYAPDVPDSMRPHASGEAAASREEEHAAWRYIASNPGRFVAAVPRRWAHLLMGEGELAVLAFHPAATDPKTSYSDKVRDVGAPRLLLLWVPYALLFLLGVAGLLTRPWEPLTGVFLSLAAAMLLVHGVTFGGGRYHALWMPLLALFAAERLTGAAGMRPFRGAVALAWAAFAVLCVTAWLLEGAHYL